jgi:fermentation-respiration switch protein FrsA (DUF1100 family)
MKDRLKTCTAILLSAALLAGCGDGLFYHPDPMEYGTPAQANQKYEDVYFTSRDGTRLHGWFIPAIGHPKATIVHFHGNGQNLSAHYDFIAWLPQEGYNVFTFDYRGYGKSEGKPERQGIHDDAQAALDYIAARNDTGTPNLVVFGQSLGGAIAIVAVAERKQGIRAVIIDSTFTSYRDIARDKVHAVPVIGSLVGSAPSLLASNEYNPIDYIGKLAPIPLMLMHGSDDPVIPIAHSKRLFEKAGEPKQFWVQNGGGHIQAFSRYLPQMKPIVLRFLDQALADTAGQQTHANAGKAEVPTQQGAVGRF